MKDKNNYKIFLNVCKKYWIFLALCIILPTILINYKLNKKTNSYIIESTLKTETLNKLKDENLKLIKVMESDDLYDAIIDNNDFEEIYFKYNKNSDKSSKINWINSKINVQLNEKSNNIDLTIICDDKTNLNELNYIYLLELQNVYDKNLKKYYDEKIKFTNEKIDIINKEVSNLGKENQIGIIQCYNDSINTLSELKLEANNKNHKIEKIKEKETTQAISKKTYLKASIITIFGGLFISLFLIFIFEYLRECIKNK